MKSHCERCGKKMTISTGSYFNLEQICMECDEEEKAHPDYQKAKDADHQAILRGDYNFPGIGLPDDLKWKAYARRTKGLN